MSENKTKPTEVSVEAYIDAVPNEARREDARTLLALLTELSGESPRMWGSTMIGFGSYDYVYDSGRSGTAMRIGFAPRKREQVLYIMGGFDGHEELLARLGKFKTGKACLYVTRLSQIDLGVLRELCTASLAYMDAKYPRSA